MQCRQTAARKQHQKKPADAYRGIHARSRSGLALHAPEEHPTSSGQHHRKQKCRPAEQEKQQIGSKRTDRPDTVVHHRGDPC